MSEGKFNVYDENGRVLKGHRDYGKIIEDIPRSDPELIRRLAKYGASKVAELQLYGGVMNQRIKPIKTGFHIAGPAFTAMGKPGDMLFPAVACSLAKEGDVLVFGGGSQSQMFAFGDGVGGFIKRKGVAGLISDGATHDLQGLCELDLPMFCQGDATYPGSSGGPGAVNIPVACGDVVVNPGDIIIADDDCIVVVPYQDLERMVAVAEAQHEIDLVRRQRSKEGASLIQLNNLGPMIDKWTKFQKDIQG